MQINPEITEILKEFKIDKDTGLLCLLGFYFNLDVEKICPEEVINSINLTKIVDKDYDRNTIVWNRPLFTGQQTEWDWIKTEYNILWDRNRERKASNPDCAKRMQEFFKKYPHIRKDDVIQASKAYHNSTDSTYLKNSAAFIFDGAGAMKKSILLGWCEKIKEGRSSSQMKGTIIK